MTGLNYSITFWGGPNVICQRGWGGGGEEEEGRGAGAGNITVNRKHASPSFLVFYFIFFVYCGGVLGVGDRQ